jgi:hypothetical protein
VLKCILVREFPVSEAHNFIEDTQRIAHTAFALLCNHLERSFFSFDVFFIADFLEMINRVVIGDPFEVEYLAT